MGGSGSDKMKDRRVKELSSEATIENEEEAEVPVYWGQAINKRRAAKDRVRTRFGIYEKVLKMTVPISRPGKGLEMRQKHEKVWKITLA